MNNFYKTLIVVTSAIAVFFFGKWVWEVAPRYEIQESIITIGPYGKVSVPSNAEVFCTSEIDIEEWSYRKEYDLENRRGIYLFSNRCSLSLISTTTLEGDLGCKPPEQKDGYCYIKQRVKVK